MPWFRMDDDFADHPKVVDLDLASVGLWSLAGAYCSHYLTDGAITVSSLRRIAPHITLTTKKKLAAKLVERGLWETTEDGWQIHDFNDYNPYAEAEKEKRRKRSIAGRKGGIESGKTRRAEANYEANASPFASSNSEANGKQNTNPVPSRPDPSPCSTSSSSSLSQSEHPGERDPRVDEALDWYAEDVLQDRIAAGVAIPMPDAYRKAVRAQRAEADGPDLDVIAKEYPGLTSAELRTELEDRRFLA